MEKFMACPVCSHDDWAVLAEKVFSVKDIDAEDAFNKAILEFVFETWFTDRTELCVKNICCNYCGFICFWPRPTDPMLAALRQKHTTNQVGFCPMTDVAVSQQRSGKLFDYLRSTINLDKIDTVLDYGGMDGNLMQAFLAHNKKCFLIDYCSYCIPNVTKISDTVEGLNAEDTFDLIICSHVIEHIASPVEILRSLANHLTQDGILFVEVPMEIWKRPPILAQRNPITHVNFFSPNSISNVFRAGGLTVDRCHLTEYLHTTSSWNPGIRCLGRRSGSPRPKPLLKSDAYRFLNPTAMSYLHFYLRNPRRLKRELLKRIGL